MPSLDTLAMLHSSCRTPLVLLILSLVLILVMHAVVANMYVFHSVHPLIFHHFHSSSRIVMYGPHQ
jgi:hypothetical protein